VELYALYSLSSITPLFQVDTNETSTACCTYAGDERCMQGFGGEPGSHWHRWEDSIRVDPARAMQSFVTSSWVDIFFTVEGLIEKTCVAW
jgi:hypothetical protein